MLDRFDEDKVLFLFYVVIGMDGGLSKFVFSFGVGVIWVELGWVWLVSK